MGRLNINILGIGELKLMGWENLIQMIIISTTMDKNPLEKVEQPLVVDKSLKCISKMTK